MTGTLLGATKRVLAVPLLLPLAALVALVGDSLTSAMDSASATMKLRDALHEAESNHARFEGTWTPHEARLESYRRETKQWDDRLFNHSQAEGSEFTEAA